MSGANIVWHAGADIILGPFFQANQGSDFEASIVPCGTLRPNKIEIDDKSVDEILKEINETL